MSASSIIRNSPTNTPQLTEKRKSPQVKEPDPGTEQEEHGRVEWTEIARIAFVALAAAAVWFRLWEPFAHISVIGIAATLIGGYPIFKEAFEKRAIVVTGKTLGKSPLLAKVTGALGARCACVFTGVRQHVPIRCGARADRAQPGGFSPGATASGWRAGIVYIGTAIIRC